MTIPIPTRLAGPLRRSPAGRWGNAADRGDRARGPSSGWPVRAACESIPSTCLLLLRIVGCPPSCGAVFRRFQGSAATVLPPESRLTLPADRRTLRRSSGLRPLLAGNARVLPSDQSSVTAAIRQAFMLIDRYITRAQLHAFMIVFVSLAGLTFVNRLLFWRLTC